MITCAPHPLLAATALRARFPAPVGGLPASAALRALLAADAAAPVRRTEETRQAIRRLLRHSGHRPAGRGKPSSEYLVRAAAEGRLAPILLPVDAGNAVSLHSGIPVSVVDAARLEGALSIAPGGAEERYVFNAGGQEIALGGLLCLRDARGPCANAVRDSQRTKADAATREALLLLWGSRELAPDLMQRTAAWAGDLLAATGAATVEVPVRGAD